jgi:hypothetical protein
MPTKQLDGGTLNGAQGVDLIETGAFDVESHGVIPAKRDGSAPCARP